MAHDSSSLPSESGTGNMGADIGPCATRLTKFTMFGVAETYSFAKSRSRMKVSDVGRNLIPDTWIADRGSAYIALYGGPISELYAI